jgi:hypothetical protein
MLNPNAEVMNPVNPNSRTVSIEVGTPSGAGGRVLAAAPRRRATGRGRTGTGTGTGRGTDGEGTAEEVVKP